MLPVALTIAGSDSSGAAGLQADLPTFAALGVHAASVVTMVTAQDSRAIYAVHLVPVEVIDAQLRVVVADLAPTATKTGLLGPAEAIRVVATAAHDLALPCLVVDPVLVDGANRPLVDEGGLAAYAGLIAAATVVTPNRAELGLLLGMPLVTVDDVVGAAPAVRALGAVAVLVTGGRDPGVEVTDVLITAEAVAVLSGPRIGAAKARGSGCTLSAALAAGLARGDSVQEAVGAARAFVRAQLAGAPPAPGAGRLGVSHVVDAGSPRRAAVAQADMGADGGER